MTRRVALRRPLQLAIAENATTPAAAAGTTIWSSTALKKLTWDGTKWAGAAAGGGGSGVTAVTQSAGAADAGKVPMLGAGGYLDPSFSSDMLRLTPMDDWTANLASLYAMRQGTGCATAWLTGGGYNRRFMQVSPITSRARYWKAFPNSAGGLAKDLSFAVQTGSVTTRLLETQQASGRGIARLGYATTTTVQSTAGIQCTSSIWSRTPAGFAGGCMMHARVCFPTTLVGARLFIGLSTVATSWAMASEPSTFNNVCGFSLDSTDTNLQFISKSGAGTGGKTATSLARTGMFFASSPSTEPRIIDFMIVLPTNGTRAFGGYRLPSLNQSRYIPVLGSTAGAPDASIFVAPMLQIGNAASAQVVGFDVSHVYVEENV